ncbi:Undecaprenyl-diphosphatase [Clavibacter michiganensis]|uniref:Undecaprenyl-diphosphatase n=1 Tax=Clavibacter michiganensis TaxID=28447 RepID=A0A251YFI4_9MICO|nr:undecaprenyl-diphosphate phosphatase [Clavibacter michiganensis]OUE23005.1 Undecaprenyl-diphosphatase [Clavibacter michiganensis]
MSYLEAIILGLVQGLTEFLPISSSAHLRIAGLFMGGDPGATFTAITQLGTELAVVVFFRKRIGKVLSAWFRSLRGGMPKGDPDVRMGWLVIIGTIPIGIAGYLFQDTIRSTFRSLWIVAIVLIVFGILLGLADRYSRSDRAEEDMTYGHGVSIGIAQALALVPGVSRSGATTTAARAFGYARPVAAEYSFLLAVPAVFGSGLYELVKSFDETGQAGAGQTAVATLIAFVVGLAVIAGLMRYISTRTFMPFVVYRVALGVVLLVLLGTGAIAA